MLQSKKLWCGTYARRRKPLCQCFKRYDRDELRALALFVNCLGRQISPAASARTLVCLCFVCLVTGRVSLGGIPFDSENRIDLPGGGGGRETTQKASTKGCSKSQCSVSLLTSTKCRDLFRNYIRHLRVIKLGQNQTCFVVWKRKSEIPGPTKGTFFATLCKNPCISLKSIHLSKNCTFLAGST